MTFPNGYHGVKKIFTAEILSLISGVLLLAAGVAGLASLASLVSDTPEVAVAGIGGAGVLGLIAGILAIIAGIMRLVGLHQAGKEDDFFRNAFLIAIFALIMAVVAAVMAAIFGQNSVIDDIVQILQRIANIFVIFLVITGVQSFAVKLNHEKLAYKGNKIAWLIALPYILAAIAGLLFGLFGINETTGSIASIMQLVSGILTIVGSILYLVYLGQAKKMLKEN